MQLEEGQKRREWVNGKEMRREDGQKRKKNGELKRKKGKGDRNIEE